jgi:hypothetical protein
MVPKMQTQRLGSAVQDIDMEDGSRTLCTTARRVAAQQFVRPTSDQASNAQVCRQLAAAADLLYDRRRRLRSQSCNLSTPMSLVL